ncbi:hypothetical protein GGH19_000431 [Coemansia sp. RSA 1807]|nr:hypothetical protein GGF48_001141 [Coemansia sp. RSA 921]KAJ2201569.1 hypothetical protein IW144_000179 [Coemansia sp. RSA 522]KAJ2280313.1 hypothetical protein EV176_001076 [Coemansia sp. RSA 451]KAJ2294034.1 hypothetical protein IW141_000647 [Coemansia sp. RSA 355]KAJ2533188.1 hypothetical protein GGH20_000790 [Coemansia sp. RSA 1937]KAJ2578522.1 hypothetical protein GGH19_000431 [Coemansia sp. RSA 1807]KAJ2729695.1 hypothetical protein H4S00_000357 [Coemansia sp. D1744]
MDPSCAFDRVAVVGTGGYGWHFLCALLATKRLHVRAVTSTTDTQSSLIKQSGLVKQKHTDKQKRIAKLRELGAEIVEYDDPASEAFAAAFSDIHTVVSAVGLSGVTSQIAMIDGALAAGVRWFIPSEYGVAHYTSTWMPFPSPLAPKTDVDRYLRDHAMPRGLAHTVIYTGMALDYLDPASIGLKLASRSATLVGRGGTPVSFTPAHNVVQLVCDIVQRPHEMMNRTIRFASSTAKMRELIKVATNGEHGERVKIVCVDEAKAKFCELAKHQDPRAFQIYSRLLIEEGLGQINRMNEPLDNAMFPDIDAEPVGRTLERLMEHSEPNVQINPTPAHRTASAKSVTDGLGRRFRDFNM